MPKKQSWGENSKAVEAKARKNTALKAEQEKKQKEQEDLYWHEDDKNLQKKQGRKEDKEKQRLEKLERKKEIKMLEEAEEVIVKSSQPQAKLTRAQITAEQEKREAAARKATCKTITPAVTAPKPPPIEENLNRLISVEEEARTVDEALKMLKVDDSTSSADRHPERRAKAAHAAFEEIRLPQLKSENPSLKLSQLKQMLHLEWQKSPDNPINQERVAYNAKK